MLMCMGLGVETMVVLRIRSFRVQQHAVEGNIEREGEYIVICHRFNNSALFMFMTRVYSKFASCSRVTPPATQSGGSEYTDHLN